jgi:hypothetical protein
MAKWLDKYNTPEAQNGIEGTMAGLTDKGFNYNGAWGGTMAMGGSLPGSVGFTYARTQDSAPSNGKYAKKTKASAQNGQEMKFYQEGLDWKPKNISQNGTVVPNWATDINTRLLNAVSTFGGSAIGDAVKGVSPRAADWLNENSMGFIPYTTDEQLMATRAGNPDRGVNTAVQASDAVTNLLLNKMIGPLAGKANTAIKKETNKVVKGATNFAQDFSKGYKAVPTREDGGIIEDDRGQWEYPGEITKINSNQITMQGVDYPVLGISDTGDTQMMQPGQDYTYEGDSVTEIPMMQGGGNASLRSLINDEGLKSKSDATKVVPQKTITKEQADKFKAKKDAEELKRRKQAIKTSNAARNKPLSIQNIADESGAIGDKFRMFPNDPNSFIDEYINPGVMVGNMASSLGRFPLNIQEGNYGQAAMSVATPLAFGALETIAAPYANEALRPITEPIAQYLPKRGEVFNELSDLQRAIFPTKPTFINPTEQELLSTVRNVGIMSKTGANDATVLEKILNKSSQLGEKEFENLVGSTRSQIKEKIQAIKASGSAKKPDVNTETTIASELGIDQDPSWLRIQERLRDRARSLSTPNYDENGFSLDEVGNIISEPSTADIARAIQASGEIDLSTINSSQAQRARRVQELMANSFNVSSTTPPSYFSLENTGLFDFSGPTNKSLIRGLTERVNKNKYLPLVADESDNLLPVLYRDASNNPAVEMLKAYRTLESAPKGSTFKGASSLSTDSYPATLRMTQKALKSDIADVNYIGMGDLNFSGFSQLANVPKDVNLKEINTIIDQLNKKLPKPIPYAYKKGYDIVAPQITVTKKKNGGWLSKYN